MIASNISLKCTENAMCIERFSDCALIQAKFVFFFFVYYFLMYLNDCLIGK